MRCSCGFFSEPRQYAAATRMSFDALPIQRCVRDVGGAAEVLPDDLAVFGSTFS